MAGCIISTGREEACKDSIGGIKAVYFFNDGEAVFTVNEDTGCVTAIDDGSTGAAPAYKYVTRHGSSLEQAITSAPENGTVFFSQTTNLQLKRLDAQTSKEVKLMAWGTPRLVVHDNNGKAWLTGWQNGNDVSGGTITTGVAKGDLSGYTLNFLAEERSPAFEIVGATTEDPFADANMQVDVTTGNAGGGGALTILEGATTAASGTYTAGTPVTIAEFVDISMNFTSAGNWGITTVADNGVLFSGSGSTGCSGTQVIRLQAYGTPIAAAAISCTVDATAASVGVITGTTDVTATAV